MVGMMSLVWIAQPLHLEDTTYIYNIFHLDLDESKNLRSRNLVNMLLKCVHDSLVKQN